MSESSRSATLLEMKGRTRFRNYISIQAVTVIAVLVARSMLPSPQLVTLVTFLLYLMAMVGILFWEVREKDFRRYLTVYIGMAFILFGILPVLALRIMEWSAPFEWVGMLSMSGTQWEKIGNGLFTATLIAHFIDSTRHRLAESKD